MNSEMLSVTRAAIIGPTPTRELQKTILPLAHELFPKGDLLDQYEHMQEGANINFAEIYSLEKDATKNYWNKITCTTNQHEDGFDSKSSRLDQEFAFLAPNEGRWGPVQFYWDTYFMIQAIKDIPEKLPLAVGMIHNLANMLHKWGIIPNASSEAFLMNSQPPFLTSMILDVYNALPDGQEITAAVSQDLKEQKVVAHNKHVWLEMIMDAAKDEYNQVWTDPNDIQEQVGSYHHRIKGTILSRYGNRDEGNAKDAEREAGTDYTLEYYNRCNEFLPVSLNALLFKYEMDFAKAAEILAEFKTGKEREAKLAEAEMWKAKAEARNQQVRKLMMREDEDGSLWFFNFDFYKGGILRKGDPDYYKDIDQLTPEDIQRGRSEFYSLTGLLPLWAGMVTPEEGLRMMRKLPKFATDRGFVMSAPESLPIQPDFDDLRRQGLGEEYIEDLKKRITPKQWDVDSWSPWNRLVDMATKQLIEQLSDGPERQALIIFRWKSLVNNIMALSDDFRHSEGGTFHEKRSTDGPTPEMRKSQQREVDAAYAHQEDIAWSYAEVHDTLRELDDKAFWQLAAA